MTAESQHQRMMDRYEDVCFMLEMGETRHGAAFRLGITVKALDKLIRRGQRAESDSAAQTGAGEAPGDGALPEMRRAG